MEKKLVWGTHILGNPPGRAGLLHLARDTRHLHETAQLQGKEQRLLWMFFGKVQSEDLLQKKNSGSLKF